MILALTGGTGGAKLIEGLAAELDPDELTIVCNTADDTVVHGLHVSPDLDTITYTLAGLIDPDQGWGLKNDTFAALQQLGRLGGETWFKLGDRDLALHIRRTQLMNDGLKLSEVTAQLRRALGVRAKILPMSDDKVQTRVNTPEGEISFQEFFVKEHWAREVTGIRFSGVEQSQPAIGVLEAMSRAEGVIICPSNPITSIGPILAVPGIRSALAALDVAIVGVSPLIGTTAVSGPAHKLMITCGYAPSALGVARNYADILDRLFIAVEDQNLASSIQDLSIGPVCTDIRMTTANDKRRLAAEVLASLEK
ncbi:MAG TPA: 2-phospho-L-lactate transferase [Candidatus Binatia bacterium]|nr:2-phospho-L-lactate transferase [Candidatus Binatia bacterium]